MGIASWLATKALLYGQSRQQLAVDPALLSGHAPSWSVSLFRSGFLLMAEPFVIWLAFAVMPAKWVLELGHLADVAIWSHIKSTDLSGCITTCRGLAFGMIALPLSWFAGIAGAFWWYRCVADAFEYQATLLRTQAVAAGATTNVDKIAGVFRRYRELLPLTALSIIILHAAAFLLVGEVEHTASGPRAERAYTGGSFAAFCALLNLLTAGVGAHVFIARRMPALR